MKAVGISASPRRSGNSEILLDRALEGAASAGADIGKIVLSELDFKPCQECGGCDNSGVCVIRDGMDRIYGELDKAGAVLIASPVFFANLSAQAKMMIDRFQCAWIAKYILKPRSPVKRRRGIFIATAGSYRKDHFKNAGSVVKAFFATIDAEYAGELFCGGIEKTLVISQDEKTLNKAYELGKGLVKADE